MDENIIEWLLMAFAVGGFFLFCLFFILGGSYSAEVGDSSSVEVKPAPVVGVYDLEHGQCRLYNPYTDYKMVLLE